MKICRPVVLSLLLVSLLQTGCRRDDDDLIPDDDCFISANVDGQDYLWDLNNCALDNMMLRVGDITTDEAELTLAPVTGTASFQSDDPNIQLTFFLTLGPGLQIIPGQAAIEITSFSDTAAEGTFEGIFTDIGGANYQVANGEFRAVY